MVMEDGGGHNLLTPWVDSTPKPHKSNHNVDSKLYLTQRVKLLSWFHLTQTDSCDSIESCKPRPWKFNGILFLCLYMNKSRLLKFWVSIPKNKFQPKKNSNLHIVWILYQNFLSFIFLANSQNFLLTHGMYSIPYLETWERKWSLDSRNYQSQSQDQRQNQ